MDGRTEILMVIIMAVLTVLICIFFLCRKDLKIKELEGRCVKLDFMASLNWHLWSLILTDKSVRKLLYHLEDSDISEEEAREIADTRAFQTYIYILESLLSSPQKMEGNVYQCCLCQAEQLCRVPALYRAVCMKGEKYPSLSEIMISLKVR